MKEYFLADILFRDEAYLLLTMLRKKNMGFRCRFIEKHGRKRRVCNIKEIAMYLEIAKEFKYACNNYVASDTKRRMNLIEKLEKFIKDYSWLNK